MRRRAPVPGSRRPPPLEPAYLAVGPPPAVRAPGAPRLLVSAWTPGRRLLSDADLSFRRRGARLRVLAHPEARLSDGFTQASLPASEPTPNYLIFLEKSPVARRLHK